jgi:hypothetical protein
MVKDELNGESNGVHYVPKTETLFTNAVEHPIEVLTPLKGKEYKMK